MLGGGGKRGELRGRGEDGDGGGGVVRKNSAANFLTIDSLCLTLPVRPQHSTIHCVETVSFFLLNRVPSIIAVA